MSFPGHFGCNTRNHSKQSYGGVQERGGSSDLLALGQAFVIPDDKRAVFCY